MAKVGRDLWSLCGPTLVFKQGHLEQVMQGHAQATFEDLQGGTLHNLCQHSANLLCSSLCPLPIVSSLGTTEKRLALSSLHALTQVLQRDAGLVVVQHQYTLHVPGLPVQSITAYVQREIQLGPALHICKARVLECWRPAHLWWAQPPPEGASLFLPWEEYRLK